MALKIEIQNVSSYESTTSEKESNNTISLTTDKKTASIFLKYDNTIQEYVLSVLMMTFRKRMYHPTEIVLELQIMPVQGEFDSGKWNPIVKSTITTLLKNKQVSIYDLTRKTVNEKGESIIPEEGYLGKDFYVKEVVPTYMPTSMRVKLFIYSPDHELTLQHTSRTFVSKKLSTILSEELIKDKVKLPYDKDKTIKHGTQMKVLPYNSTEHIFPYLVQYNESFYDMLARTTNRWGEFLYYENGQLNVGYQEVDKGKEKTIVKVVKISDNEEKIVTDFDHLTYINYEDGASIGNNYDLAAAYDANILDSPLDKSPNKVEGYFFEPGKKMDKAIMKAISSFFKNDKTLFQFATNLLFDDIYGAKVDSITVDHNNEEFNSTYFNADLIKKSKEKYNAAENKYNPFSEESSEYKVDKYRKIVSKEQAASKDALNIFYDTTYPGLKLGDIITYSGKTYIVVHIEGRPKDPSWLSDDMWVISGKDDPTVYYQVIATPMDEDKKYYPTIIAQGHVRYADPQIGVVSDDDDPLGEGRVRVLFPWQSKSDTASPWLKYVGNSGGSTGLIGKHYKDDTVFVGFVDGNVERPYVLGCLQKGTGSDIECTSPGGHTLTISDDDQGISKFVLGTLTPVVGTAKTFFPGIDTNFLEGWKKNLCFAGGFELKDKYGLYKISGSTDSRKVAIESPWGNVNINAFTGISISAPNGDVKISGKNVTIEAGNNLKLLSGKNVDKAIWHTGKQETWGGNFAQMALDITTAVTKKLSENLITLVDLSIIRSILEVCFRPQEGTLTVKSNRFLKLEAGSNKAKIPEVAYNKKKKEAMLNAENKSTILSAVGSGRFLDRLTNLSLDNGMVTMISAIKPATKGLVDTFKSRLNACITAKKNFDNKFSNLKKYSNDKEAGCKAYNDLKDEFWKAEEKYIKWDEAKLEFKANVAILKGADLDDLPKLRSAVEDDCLKRLAKKNIILTEEKSKQGRQEIIAVRVQRRAAVLDAANALRKAICDLMSIQELKRKDVLKYFSSYWQTMPDNFKTSLVDALSKDACKDSPIFTPTEKMMEFGSNRYEDLIDFDVEKHLRRLVAYNLLINLGFSEDSRKEVNNAKVPEPKTKDFTSTGATSLLNLNYWSNYVASLSGVPPISKDSKTFGAQIRNSVTAPINDLTDSIMGFKDMWDEFWVWGEGKEGRILFATDKNTYQMEKNTFQVVKGIKPTLRYLKEDDISLGEGQKDKLKQFVAAVRNALTKDNF